MKLKNLLKIIHKALLGLVLLAVLFFNIRLYYKPDFSEGYNQDVYHQLSHLKEVMHLGAPDEMQGLFPEGFLFMHALYSLTWLEIMRDLEQQHPVFQKGMNEVSWSLEKMESTAGKSIFSKELPLPYGAFYRGWTNYILSKKLAIDVKNGIADTMELNRFKSNCDVIHQAFANSNTTFLESYNYQTWPADNLVAMASLSNHDRLLGEKYGPFIQNWIEQVHKHLDPATGLIPHAVSSRTDGVLIGARGSSQSLMNIFLPEIDSVFAKEQFLKYRELFLDHRLSLPGIREYPLGQTGNGDVDSGPVIWDIGGSASIVGVRTMGVHEDWDLHAELRNCVESFGAPVTFKGKKKYLFGKLPMADAFIAWSNSVVHEENNHLPRGWSWRVQVVSAILIMVGIWVILKW